MIDETQRRQLFDALVKELGEGPAVSLMEMLPPGGWDDLARRADLAELRGEFGELRGEFGELRAEVGLLDGRLTGQIGELRGEVRGLEARLTGEVAALGSRLDAQLAKLITANVVTSGALAGLAFAAARLGA